MIKNSYTIDGLFADEEEFRSNPQRVEAEEYLVAAYQRIIGHLYCDQHKQAAGYQLRFISATGECKISTVACCPEFDSEINGFLIQSIADSDPDNQQTS